MTDIFHDIMNKSLDKHSKHKLSKIYKCNYGDFEVRICETCDKALIYIVED